MGKVRKFVRRLSDYRTGNTTLYYKTDEFKFKLSADFESKIIRLRRKPRSGEGLKVHFELAFINMYRAYGGKFADGTFYPSPSTEVFMAMFDPCISSFLADSGKKKIASVAEDVHVDVIVESWSGDDLIAPYRFCKYHLKFRFSDVVEVDNEDEDW